MQNFELRFRQVVVKKVEFTEPPLRSLTSTNRMGQLLKILNILRPLYSFIRLISYLFYDEVQYLRRLQKLFLSYEIRQKFVLPARSDLGADIVFIVCDAAGV